MRLDFCSDFADGRLKKKQKTKGNGNRHARKRPDPGDRR